MLIFFGKGEQKHLMRQLRPVTDLSTGAIHNVSRSRVPVVIIAGTSPITDEGEMRGGRNVSFPLHDCFIFG